MQPSVEEYKAAAISMVRANDWAGQGPRVFRHAGPLIDKYPDCSVRDLAWEVYDRAVCKSGAINFLIVRGMTYIGDRYEEAALVRFRPFSPEEIETICARIQAGD